MFKDSALNVESIQQEKKMQRLNMRTKRSKKEIELLAEKQKVNEEQNQKKKIYLIASFIGIAVLIFISM